MYHPTTPVALFLTAAAALTSVWSIQPQPTKTEPDKAPGAKASTRRFGIEKPKPRPPGTIRLAAYNAENLFDDKDDPALTLQYEDKDNTKPEAELKALAATIKLIDADVLAMEEIESYDALVWFRDKYLADAGYKYAASIDAGDERGIEQSVLSRFPITETKNWPRLALGGVHPEKWGNRANENAGKPIVYHRSPLCVTIEVPANATEKPANPASAPAADAPYHLTLFVVHHKSGGKEAAYWREKETAKTIELVSDMQKQDPDRNIILLGDFNAMLPEVSIRLITQAGFFDGLRVPEDRKENAKPEPSLITHASGRILDHIFLNPAAKHEFVPESRFILGTPVRPPEADYRTTPPPEGYASDHYPLVIDITPHNRE